LLTTWGFAATTVSQLHEFSQLEVSFAFETAALAPLY